MVSVILTLLLSSSFAGATSVCEGDLNFQSGLNHFKANQFLLSAINWSLVSNSNCASLKTKQKSIFGYAQAMAQLEESLEASKALEKLNSDPNWTKRVQRFKALSLNVENEESSTLDFKIWRSKDEPWSDEYKVHVKGDEIHSVFSEKKNLNLKSPWVAGGLSALLPGAGQVYNGQYQSALVSLLLNSLLLSATIELSQKSLPLTSLTSGFVFSVLYVGNIISSAQTSQRMNESLSAPVDAKLNQLLFPDLRID
jgi:hypothetical protein